MLQKVLNLFSSKNLPAAAQAITVKAFGYNHNYRQTPYGQQAAINNNIHYVAACATLNSQMCSTVPLRLYSKRRKNKKK